MKTHFERGIVPKKKDLSPHASSDFGLLPVGLNGPELLRAIEEGRSIDFRRVDFINGAVVPALSDEWRRSVSDLFTSSLTKREFAYIDHVARAYVRERMMRRYPITWSDLIERLQGISDAAGSLLSELNNQSPAYNAAWSRIGDESTGSARLSHDDVYPLISTLYASTLKALQNAQVDRLAGGGMPHKSPWYALIYALANFSQFKGVKPKAGKSGKDGYLKNASPFVQFVWSVMQSVPHELREHSHTQGAMATEVSNTLRVWRRHNQIGSGAFRKILAEITPDT